MHGTVPASGKSDALQTMQGLQSEDRKGEHLFRGGQNHPEAQNLAGLVNFSHPGLDSRDAEQDIMCHALGKDKVWRQLIKLRLLNHIVDIQPLKTAL